MVQIPSLAPPRPLAAGSKAAAQLPPLGAQPLRSAAVGARAVSPPERLLQPVSPFREPGLQQRVAAAQQGLDYVDGLQQRLDSMQRGLDAALAGGDAVALRQPLRDLDQAWQQREAAAGGMLDGRLRLVEPGQARKLFTVRGLDLAALAEAGAETLKLSLPGQPRPLSFVLDPSRGTAAAIEALNRLLQPAGVRAAVAGSELLFSAAETAWPALRDGLRISGNGLRFPSGQAMPARLEAAGEALQPAQWRLDDPAALRASLAQANKAQAALDAAKSGLDARLAGLDGTASSTPGDLAELQDFVQSFDQRYGADAQAPLGYEEAAGLMPAVKGLQRERVQRLLA
nr:hypothetical protein [uncultured Roseateles sp.]